MRNINELIGIIKGINFDGVINDKEVVRLQSWVDKNKNLAYEPRQVELIKMVDSILEDHIIDDNERNTMLRYCRKYLNEMSDDTAKIYELNGIIEGIVCDGEVNESELYRLKEWMTQNRAIVRGHKSSEALYKSIGEILLDGVVTEDEQHQLLQMLSARISESQFETKLEYLKKQVKSKKNIGIDLIDILDNEEAMEKIHKLAEIQLGKALASYSGTYVSDQEIVFISLVLIAMLHYDGNYYESVRATYTSLYKYYTEQKVEGLIRTILNRYRSDDEERTSRARIINVALSNAIVPSHFLKSFFEFIYDIYKMNFEYNLSDDLAGDFKFVFEGLKNSILSDTDEVRLNVTKKSYKLIKSTKQLIANEKYIDSVIKLSIIIVNLIDKKMWNKEIKIFNPYLKQGYEGWIETLKDDEVVIHNRTKSEFRSRWEPKYYLQNNEIFIVPPVHRVKAQYNYYEIKIVVKNGDKETYVNTEPDIREIIGGYQVSVNMIKLDSPLGDITYQLLAGKKVIYDSRDKLYRSFIVFDNKGSEIRNNTDYSGTAIFCVNEGKTNLKPYYEAENYVLASENVKLGAAYLIDDIVFNFSSLIKSGVFGEEWYNYSIEGKASEAQLRVYKNVRYLVFEAGVNTTRFEVIIDGKYNKLDEMKYNVSEREGINKYVIDLEIDEDGIHTVEVNVWENGKKGRILAPFIFALDKEIRTESVKLNDDTYLISVNSGLLPSAITEEIHMSEYDENMISFDAFGKSYIYHIPFDFDIYRIDGNAWTTTNEGIWVGDIQQNSILDIYGTDIDELQIYSSNGNSVDEILKLKNKGVYQQIPIGFLVSYKMTYDYIILLFLKDGKRKKGIFCYNKCILDEEKIEIKYDMVVKSLDIVTVYYGKGNVFFTITDKHGYEVYRSSYQASGELETVNNLKSFEKYLVSFYEKEKGLSLKKERLLKEYETMFYAREDFIGRSFKITEVQFDQFVRGEFLRKNHYFNKIYVYFSEQDEENRDLFRGEVYVRTYNGTFMLDNINPVEIEICSDVIDGTMELSITKDGDGLLLDFEHHGIMNTMDDDKAVDIFSYTMDMNGVKLF